MCLYFDIKQLKTILSLWTIPKRTAVQIWLIGCSSLTLSVQEGREIQCDIINLGHL